jgi:hypothetical protein
LTVLATVRRSRQLLGRFVDGLERHPKSSVVAMACAAAAIAVALAYLVLQPFPHIPDGFSYYFQAKILASGHLSAAAPALPEFFEYEWVTAHEGRWFSIFPPGWPLILAVGIRAGAPALVNPFVGSLCIVSVYALGAALFGRRCGVLAALFCAVSPFFLFMAAGFMSHTATLLFLTLSTVCHVTSSKPGRSAGWSGAAGVMTAAALLVRPLDAVATWIGQTAHAIAWDRSPRTFARLCLSAAGTACGGAVYLIYNHELVGRWFTSPLALLSPHNRMGFGADIGESWTPFGTLGHTPWRAFLNLNHNAAVISQDLFGWPVSSLVFVLILAAFGVKDRRHWLSFGLIASFVAAYALYWYHGVAFGGRFYFALLPHLIVLTIEGIRQTPEIVACLLARPSMAGWLRRAVGPAVCLSFAFCWTVYVPKVAFVAPYRNQRDVTDDFYRHERSEGWQNAVVFVRAPRIFYYGPAFISNALPIGTGSVIYALDRGTANRRLMAAFPGRSASLYRFERAAGRPPAWLPAFIRNAGPSR